MNLLEKLFSRKAEYRKPDVPAPGETSVQVEKPQPEANWSGSYGPYSYANVFTVPFNGEKNVGEIGPILNYVPDYDALRYRSWQMYVDSEITQTVIGRYLTWVIGSGLKLQCEPQKTVLESEQIRIDTEIFNKVTEARFSVYSDGNMSAYANMGSLHTIAAEAEINALIGGDCLVVLRLINNEIKVEIIDGAHVCTPLGMAMGVNGTYTTGDGNRVINGVELSATGEHIAYHVKTDVVGEYKRISARAGKTGHVMAFMVYGLRYRLNHVRGIPLIIAVMETAKKLERYKEATVGSAEERQKIPFFIEHGVASSGENPLLEQVKAARLGATVAGTDAIKEGEVMAGKVAATMNKSVYNMPQDSRIVQLESKNELSFAEFYTKNIDLVCATVGIPPNVALSKYDDNFSASRAAIMDWAHTLSVKRKQFSDQFYRPVYNLWLHTQILLNKITAEGYLAAFAAKNTMAVEAYRRARFVGAGVPHIDPLKEVMAERAKPGPLGANLPLTTAEAATEALSSGEFAHNVEQFARELEEADKLGLQADTTTELGTITEDEKEAA